MKGKGILPALAAALLFFAPARAEWYVFPAEDPPRELTDTAMEVCEYTGEITLSFLGDCTLGGESRFKSAARGFVSTAGREGYAYFFENLLPLLSADDISVVNLEGVLSDRQLEKTPKTFNFIGPAAFAKILALGGVEAAGLANNHSLDYGEAGYRDTQNALAAAGVASFGADHLAVWTRDGVRVGFTASAFSLTESARSALEAQVRTLRALGCQLVVHSMHAGTEYSSKPTGQQKAVARAAAQLGVNLVVGHHPHVLHGMDVVEGVPVVYSLGNAVFGGNCAPSDMDALLLQATFAFSEGAPQSVRLAFHPIQISGQKGYNDYRPVLLSGGEAQRVMERLEKTTGYPLPGYVDGAGAVTEALACKGMGEANLARAVGSSPQASQRMKTGAFSCE